jgi:hypothetical protein
VDSGRLAHRQSEAVATGEPPGSPNVPRWLPSRNAWRLVWSWTGSDGAPPKSIIDIGVAWGEDNGYARDQSGAQTNSAPHGAIDEKETLTGLRAPE